MHLLTLAAFWLPAPPQAAGVPSTREPFGYGALSSRFGGGRARVLSDGALDVGRAPLLRKNEERPGLAKRDVLQGSWATGHAPPLIACTRGDEFLGSTDTVGIGELAAGYIRMVDVKPSVDLTVNTLSFFCKSECDMSFRAGIYSKQLRRLVAATRFLTANCDAGSWQHARLGENVTLSAGSTYYLAHMLQSGIWASARGAGDRVKTKYTTFWHRIRNKTDLPLHLPEMHSEGDEDAPGAVAIIATLGKCKKSSRTSTTTEIAIATTTTTRSWTDEISGFDSTTLRPYDHSEVPIAEDAPAPAPASVPAPAPALSPGGDDDLENLQTAKGEEGG